MLAYPIATALLLLGQGTTTAAAAKKKTSTTGARKAHPDKPNFLRKMDGHKKHARRRKLSVKDFEAELYGDSKKSAELRQKVIEKSTMVKPPGVGGNKRRLQNNGNYNANSANGNYQYNYKNNNANNANNPYNNGGNYVYDEYGNVKYNYDNNQDGTDDYFQANSDWENDFGFDASQFSLSYHRCAAVRQYDDQVAAMEDTDSVFATKRFAVFRFCPAQTCMGWEAMQEDWECDEDTYGQSYCEALGEYMEVMQNNAQNYRENGNGWNGYNQNGGYDQANNWMEVNQDNYQEDGYNYANNAQYQEEEEEELYGARGDGCQSNYGEYMMEMGGGHGGNPSSPGGGGGSRKFERPSERRRRLEQQRNEGGDHHQGSHGGGGGGGGGRYNDYDEGGGGGEDSYSSFGGNRGRGGGGGRGGRGGNRDRGGGGYGDGGHGDHNDGGGSSGGGGGGSHDDKYAGDRYNY